MKQYETWQLELKIFEQDEIFTLVSSREATDDRYEDNWWTDN